jgi:hypothetical protein
MSGRQGVRVREVNGGDVRLPVGKPVAASRSGLTVPSFFADNFRPLFALGFFTGISFSPREDFHFQVSGPKNRGAQRQQNTSARTACQPSCLTGVGCCRPQSALASRRPAAGRYAGINVRHFGFPALPGWACFWHASCARDRDDALAVRTRRQEQMRPPGRRGGR